jgi:hypothetical protein
MMVTENDALTVCDSFGASGRKQLVAQRKQFGIRIISEETYSSKDMTA